MDARGVLAGLTVARVFAQSKAFAQCTLCEESAGQLVRTFGEALLEALVRELPALALEVGTLAVVSALALALLEEVLGAGATVFGFEPVEQAALNQLVDVLLATLEAVRLCAAAAIPQAALEQLLAAQFAVLTIDAFLDATFDEVAHVQVALTGAGIDRLFLIGLTATSIEAGVQEFGRVHLAAPGLDAFGETGLEGLVRPEFAAPAAVDGRFAFGEAAPGDTLGHEAAGVFAAAVCEAAPERQGAGFATTVVTEGVAGTNAVLDAGMEEAARAHAAGLLAFVADEAALEEFGGGLAAVLATESDLMLAEVEQPEGFISTSLLVEPLLEAECEGVLGAAFTGIGQPVRRVGGRGAGTGGKGEQEQGREGGRPQGKASVVGHGMSRTGSRYRSLGMKVTSVALRSLGHGRSGVPVMPGDQNLGHSSLHFSKKRPLGKLSRPMGNPPRGRPPGSGPRALETGGDAPSQALLDALRHPVYHSRLPSVGR